MPFIWSPFGLSLIFDVTVMGRAMWDQSHLVKLKVNLFIFFPPNSLTLSFLVHAEVLFKSRINAIWSQPSTNGHMNQWSSALAFYPSENRKTKNRFNFSPWKYYKTVKKYIQKGRLLPYIHRQVARTFYSPEN